MVLYILTNRILVIIEDTLFQGCFYALSTHEKKQHNLTARNILWVIQQ